MLLCDSSFRLFPWLRTLPPRCFLLSSLCSQPVTRGSPDCSSLGPRLAVDKQAIQVDAKLRRIYTNDTVFHQRYKLKASINSVKPQISFLPLSPLLCVALSRPLHVYGMKPKSGKDSGSGGPGFESQLCPLLGIDSGKSGHLAGPSVLIS